MAKTLYELAMEYLNQGMPDITQAPRTVNPTIPVTPKNPNVPTARISPMPGGGGGGGSNDFNPYNPDPNTVRNSSNYSPYASRQASERSYIGAPGDYSYSSGTEAQKMMDNYPEYYEGKQLTGLPGAAQNYLKNSFLGKGLTALGDMLPVNRRAILENELLGSGMQLDGTGQFVSDGGAAYKADGSNIMAGYNSYHVDRGTFQKRRDRAAKNMDPNSKAFKDFNIALDAAEKNFFGAKTKADMVYDDKKLAKDPTYKSLADKIATGNAINLEKEGDEDIDIFDPNNKIKNTSVFTKTPTDVFYDDFPDTITDKDNNDFDGITPITGGTDQNDYTGLGPITGGTDQNDYTGLGPITGGTNQNDYTGLGPIIGGTNQNDYIGLGPITGETNQNDYTGPITGGTNQNDYTGNMGPITGGMNLNDYDSGYDFSDFDDGDNSRADPTGTGNFSDTITGNDTSPGATGGEGGAGTGGGRKIVCTMMNESYGFGSFRNKIWLKHSKGMAPEYQKGYHKIFLPLIKIAKTNRVVKKVLEHIAIHRTIDIRQEARGKTHLLGRVYRKILEPICYFVGKNG